MCCSAPRRSASPSLKDRSRGSLDDVGDVSLSDDDSHALGIPHEWRQNWTTSSHAHYGELIDVSTRTIWLSCEPMSPSDFEQLTPPIGFEKSGVGRTVHDAAVFLRSPGASTNGPLETMMVEGREFAFVAQPGRGSMSAPNVFLVDVEKHHRVLYRAGRVVEVLRDECGTDLVLQITEAQRPGSVNVNERLLPQGWTSRFVTFSVTTVLDVSSPARIASFSNGHVFHGPVVVPETSSESAY